MRAFWTTYLSPQAESTDAVMDSVSCLYKHKTLIHATTERAIVAELKLRGATAVDIKPARIRKLNPFDRRITRQYKIDLLQAILNNCDSGLSASKAFATVAESETGAARIRLDHGVQALAAGGQFSDALEATGIYDDTTLLLINAGERGGRTTEALTAAIEHVKGTAAKSALLLGLAVAASVDFMLAIPSVAAVRFQVLPMLKENGVLEATAEQAAEFESRLNTAFLVHDALLVLAAVIVLLAIFGLACLVEKKGRDLLNRLALNVPGLRSALLNTALAGSMRSVSNLLQGGVALLPAIDVALDGLEHPIAREYWIKVRNRISSGETVAASLRSQILTPADALLLASHRDQMQLAKQLSEVAQRKTSEATIQFKRTAKYVFGAGFVYVLISILAALYAQQAMSFATSISL